MAPGVRVPRGLFVLAKEVLRHLLRRPVVGVAVVGHDADGRVLLIRRVDTGTWALPGGTLDWGERLTTCVRRELQEEANASVLDVPVLVGAYSDPARDERFHAVTLVVRCEVRAADPRAENPLEIHEARFFAPNEVPDELAYGMREMLDRARGGKVFLE